MHFYESLFVIYTQFFNKSRIIFFNYVKKNEYNLVKLMMKFVISALEIILSGFRGLLKYHTSLPQIINGANATVVADESQVIGIILLSITLGNKYLFYYGIAA